MDIAFPLVDRYLFAVELALRVRRPRTIAQNYANESGGVNLCGPNMMIIDFAKREPLEFARYALGLADQGTATLWRTTVSPDPQFRTVTPPARLAPVDFVILGSLRYTDEHYYELLDTIKSLTKPGLLTTWLQQAGFTQVRDQTLPELGVVASLLDALTPHSLNTSRGTTDLHRGLQSLQNAALELAEGRLVIMLGSVVLAGMMTSATVYGLAGGAPRASGRGRYTHRRTAGRSSSRRASAAGGALSFTAVPVWHHARYPATAFLRLAILREAPAGRSGRLAGVERHLVAELPETLQVANRFEYRSFTPVDEFKTYALAEAPEAAAPTT